MTFAPIVSPSSKCMKNLIYVYENDHNMYLTKIYRLYYVKNIMSFVCYWKNIKYDDEYDYELGKRYLEILDEMDIEHEEGYI
jgi:hypothetical protein